MISLSIVILVLVLSFGGLYFVLKMNKSDSLKVGAHPKQPKPKH